MASERQTRIVIVDDHAVVRVGMTQLLEREDGLVVCGEARTAAEAEELVERERPDLMIVDLSLEGGSGLELIKTIRERHPSILMLVCSMHDELLFAERVLAAGARGYVMKAEAADLLVQAVRKVRSGGVYVSPAMSDRLLQTMADGYRPADGAPEERLSDRQLEVFQMIGRGLGTREIAEQLGLSVKTIETHRQEIKRRLGLETNLELVRRAVQWFLESS